MTSENGGVSASLLLALLALTGLLAAGVALARASTRYIVQDSAPLAAGTIGLVLELLAADPTPDADSLHDPVHARRDIQVRDISSAIDLNWVDPKLLEDPGVAGLLFRDGSGARHLTDLRPAVGPVMDTRSVYGHLLAEASLAFVTDYQPIQVNTAEPAMLAVALAQIGLSHEAEPILDAVRMARSEGRALAESELRSITPPEILSAACLTTHACINVNFVPEELLRVILRFGDYSVRDPDMVADTIVKARLDHEIGPVELDTIFGGSPGTSILQVVGTRTTFWRATWVEEEWVVEATIGRRMGASTDASPFAVVAVRHEKAEGLQ